MGGRQILWRTIFKTKPAMQWSSLSPEGCFAINKPPAISSAQVIRDVQAHFNPSDLFAPWLQKEQARFDRESHNKRKARNRRYNKPQQLKMGHGGTLDPMATGVLILGVGSGTKSLGNFLACTKTYECVLLFGRATDSYDTEGKVVGKKAYEHITKEQVEEELAKFKGSIMQRPPVFSALRVQGKRLYEYAREGKEVPEEIKERPVEAHELEMTEWMKGGTHSYHWPTVEADKNEKKFADKVLHLYAEATPEPETAATDAPADPATEAGAGDSHPGDKRKRHDEIVASSVQPEGSPSPKRTKSDSESDPKASGALPPTNPIETAFPSENPVPSTESKPCPAPACRIRITCGGGFYVRSLCHDLGAAVGSLGIMAELVRTRQGGFELAKNVFEYGELANGEKVWAPQVTAMLEEWTKKEGERAVQPAAPVTEPHGGSEGKGEAKAGSAGSAGGGYGGGDGGKAEPKPTPRRRRNSSSDED